MYYSSSIYDAGQALVRLINLGLEESDRAVLGSPGDATKPKILVFLYQVTENQYLKNMEGWSPESGSAPGHPMALDLYFLITVFPKQNGDDSHKDLGTVMQILHDNPVLPGSLFTEETQEIKATFHPLDLEEWSRIWTAFPDLAKGVSVSYLLSPVVLKSTRDEPVSRVVVRQAAFLTGSE